MLIYVILTTLPPERSSVATNWAAVAIIILYEVVFAFGWLGTCWVYGPEIAPLKYRHVAGSLGAAGEWFSTWIMVFGGGKLSFLEPSSHPAQIFVDSSSQRNRNQCRWPQDFHLAFAVLLPRGSLRLFSVSRE